ncbi:hypothetical protein D1007_15370 [Hordeum vulgare]|nr:hypothetical protein D1007_15370 [Hordeum vulgare]
MTEFATTKVTQMVEQHAIQDEAYVEANRQFIRQERASIDTLFAELVTEIEAEAGAKQPEESGFGLPPIYLPGAGHGDSRHLRL